MKKTLILLILSLFLLASCGTGTRLGDIYGRNPHQGTDGLVMRFLENRPLTSVLEGDEVPIEVEFINNGAANIINGRVYLGIEEAVLENRYGYDDVIQLEGKTGSSPEPKRDIKTFVVEAKELDPQTEIITTNFFVSACYQYGTEATFTVCIDPKKDSGVTQKACNVQTITSSGQGAPVVVTKVEPRMIGVEEVKPQFTLEISNKGNGEVLGFEKYDEACGSAEIYPEDLNVVDVAALLSEIPLDCQPKQVKLRKGVGTVRCALDGTIEEQTAFTSTLTVLLQYSYTTTISKEIKIQDANY